MIIRILAFILFGWVIIPLQAQQLAVSEYILYNGTAYSSYPPVEDGTPNYRDIDFSSNSNLKYHGQNWVAPMIKYDLVVNQLILFNPENDASMILPKVWIEDFVIEQDTFVNLDHREWPGLQQDGFYHRYFVDNGKLCLARYTKDLVDEGHQGRNFRYFKESVRYFVRLDPGEPFQEISTHRQLLRLDPENRRRNRRELYNIGLHKKEWLGDAITVVLSNMNP